MKSRRNLLLENLTLQHQLLTLIMEELRSYKPLFCVHHCGKTDSLFRSGQHEVMHNFVKKVVRGLNAVGG